MHILVQSVNSSVGCQLDQTVFQVIQYPLIQQGLFWSHLKDQGVVTGNCSILVLFVSRYDDHPTSIMIDFFGKFQVIKCVDSIFLFEVGLYA